MKSFKEFLLEAKGKELPMKPEDLKTAKKSFLNKGMIEVVNKGIDVIYDIQDDEYYKIKIRRILDSDLKTNYVADVEHVTDSYSSARIKSKMSQYTGDSLDALINQLKKIKK